MCFFASIFKTFGKIIKFGSKSFSCTGEDMDEGCRFLSYLSRYKWRFMFSFVKSKNTYQNISGLGNYTFWGCWQDRKWKNRLKGGKRETRGRHTKIQIQFGKTLYFPNRKRIFLKISLSYISRLFFVWEGQECKLQWCNIKSISFAAALLYLACPAPP